MCKSLIRINLAIISILLGIVGLTALSLRISLFNSQTYKEPIEKHGFYSLVTDLTSKNVFSNDAIEGNALINKQEAQELSKLFALSVIDNVDIEDILKTTIESNLDYIFTWTNSNEDLYIYFPKEKLMEGFGEENLVNIVYSGLSSILNFDTLPTCTEDQIKELENQETIDIFNLECLPEDFKKAVDQEIQNLVDELGFNNLMEEFLEDQGLEYLHEKTPVSEVIEGLVDEESVPTTLEKIDTAQKVLKISKIIPWILICLSIFFGLLTIFLGKKEFKQFVKSFTKLTFVVGFITAAVSLISKILLSSLLETRIPWDKTPWATAEFDFGIAPAQVTDVFQNVLTGIIDNIFHTPIFLASTICVVSIIIYLVTRLIDYVVGIKQVSFQSVKQTIDQNSNTNNHNQN